METSYASAIEEITQSIFATMLDLEIAAEANSYDATDEFVSSIHISGAATCSVVLGLTEGAARQTAAALLQMPVEDVAVEDKRDAAAELVNMIGGNLKGLLPQPSFLSLPAVVAGSDFQLEMPGAALAETMVFGLEQGQLRVQRYVVLCRE
jgi:chemotaxis protein CheX